MNRFIVKILATICGFVLVKAIAAVAFREMFVSSGTEATCIQIFDLVQALAGVVVFVGLFSCAASAGLLTVLFLLNAYYFRCAAIEGGQFMTLVMPVAFAAMTHLAAWAIYRRFEKKPLFSPEPSKD